MSHSLFLLPVLFFFLFLFDFVLSAPLPLFHPLFLSRRFLFWPQRGQEFDATSATFTGFSFRFQSVSRRFLRWTLAIVEQWQTTASF